MDLKNYTHLEHMHRYGQWTSAAAVRRNFATNKAVADALDRVGISDYLINPEKLKDYDQVHVSLANSLAHNLKGSFGQGAKIVAIYFKTTILSSRAYADIWEYIYPPIDRRLLTNILKIKEVKHNAGMQSFLRKYNWTQATQENYDLLKVHLTKVGLPFNWRLEVFWEPGDE